MKQTHRKRDQIVDTRGGVKEVKVLLTQSCLTLCDPIVARPPDSSVRKILQARILEWIAILFSRRSFQPRDRTQVSCITGGFFTIEPLGRWGRENWMKAVKRYKLSVIR